MPKSGLITNGKFLKSKIEQGKIILGLKKQGKRWNQDLDLLEHFYKDTEEKAESYEIEKQALKDQYEPKIVISIINGGYILFKRSSRLTKS